MKTARSLTICVLLLAVCAMAQTGYQKPSQEILETLNAPPTPTGSVNPTRTHMILAQGVRYPTIAEAAQPFLGLAGVRMNPANNGPRLPAKFVSYTIKKLDGGAEIAVKLPANGNFGLPSWSPDGKRFAFLNRGTASVELWIGETATGAVRQVKGVALNATLGAPIEWLGGSNTLLAMLVPSGRGPAPKTPLAPAGPVVQEASGSAGPVRTYQDLLTSAHDEALFDYYGTAQLATVDAASGKVTPVGKPAIFLGADPSPNGKAILVERVKKPYSYLHTLNLFPREIEVWDLAGNVVHHVASKPLGDRIPMEGVELGPRNVNWRATAASTLVWAEALDEGNPKNKVAKRDRVMMLALQAGTSKPMPQVVTETEHRYTGSSWLENGQMLFGDYDRDKRWIRNFLLDVDAKGEPKLLWSRSVQDRYKDPGSPVTRVLPNGARVVRLNGDTAFLSGTGATPQGDRPFISSYNIKTGETKELFRSDLQGYESFVALLADDGSRILTLRESPNDAPNFQVRNGGAAAVAFTKFADPTPQLRKIKKQRVTYKRADGVDLSFTLYLPPDYKEGTRLPTLVWAYPLEFNDPSTAGQVVGSTQRFTQLAGISHLFMLLSGYAVLDNATMPIIGDPETVNDTFIDQIVSSAKAAIDKAVEMGVTDGERVAVGGHSYGAFMTANLLAHSDLFRTGIARSGAYNRTLTPFGFQGERRTFWEAQPTYLKMSPFNFAHKINEPMLMIHGQADNNPGTFPIQSERMYQAVRGNGGTVRLVMLPHESHGYTARESVEHTLFEMQSWLDKYVKNPKPSTTPAKTAGN